MTSLNSISGALSDAVLLPDYEDLYVFSVVDAAEFTITVQSSDFNPVLYMFNLTVNGEAIGLLANDDQDVEDNRPFIGNTSTDGTQVMVTRPGDYVIAVVGRGRVPLSRTGPIFRFDSNTEVSGPDGVGGLNPLEGWTGEGERGHYNLVLTSTDFPISPAPGTAMGMLLGASVFVRRRR